MRFVLEDFGSVNSLRCVNFGLRLKWLFLSLVAGLLRVGGSLRGCEEDARYSMRTRGGLHT